jgi:hypothetical protein
VRSDSVSQSEMGELDALLLGDFGRQDTARTGVCVTLLVRCGEPCEQGWARGACQCGLRNLLYWYPGTADCRGCARCGYQQRC